MKYKGRLTKISENDNAVRTITMCGEYSELPRVGSRFTIYGEPLDRTKDYRMIRTGLIKEIKTRPDLEGVILVTENSTYELETYTDTNN